MLSTCIYSSTQCCFSHLVLGLPRDKWFCCDDCNRIHVALQNLVLVGAEMIPASVSYAIHIKHVEKGFTDGVSNVVQWQILSGKSCYPEHLSVLSRAVAIFRVAGLPLVATSRDNQGKSMYMDMFTMKLFRLCLNLGFMELKYQLAHAWN
ncbi:hypothetical protein HYC85_007870 [Camellia sinensis]|uniref:Uncharacterized protein n=1 Tax=Camellia sinensis TaxID=4442 RepID=A0A7J7HSJ9_CAMSI|nr:hypothetical protein HYC85_007870 [Camellia sinensis]